MYEIGLEGARKPLYKMDVSMRNAVLKASVNNMNRGGTGNIAYVKTDKQRVYNNVKIVVSFKK